MNIELLVIVFNYLYVFFLVIIRVLIFYFYNFRLNLGLKIVDWRCFYYLLKEKLYIKFENELKV